MMRVLTTFLSLLYFFNVSGQRPEEIKWIKENSIDFHKENFYLLDSLLLDKRIIFLGENTHGASEYYDVKNDLIDYLYNKLGFKVVVWESNMLDCFVVNERKESLTPSEMLGCLHFAFRCEEAIEIMKTLQEQDITLAGFDSQPTVYSANTGKLLKGTDFLNKEYRERFFLIDSLTQIPSKSNQKKSTRRKHIELFEQFREDIFRSNLDEVGKELFQRSIDDRIDFLKNLNKNREARMSGNLRYLIENVFSDQKIIVYAHNAHNDPKNSEAKVKNFTSMAEMLPPEILDQSYNIALFGYTGQAKNNFSEVYEFKEHPKESIEHYMYQSGYERTFLHISGLPNKPETNFLFKEINTMYWGKFSNPKIMAKHYDGIILINEITPSAKVK